MDEDVCIENYIAKDGCCEIDDRIKRVKSSKSYRRNTEKSLDDKVWCLEQICLINNNNLF